MTQVPFSRLARPSQDIAITPLGTIDLPGDPLNLGAFTPLRSLVQPAILGQVFDVQSVWVDAANAVDPVIIRNVQTGLYQRWPRGSCGWQFLLVKTDAMLLEAYCFSAVTITMAVCNAALTAELADAGIVRGNVYSNVTRIAAVAADTSILAADRERVGFSLYNESTATLYLLLDDGVASSVNYSVQVPPGGYFETPFNYAGAVKGIWTAAVGAAQVTEVF